MQENYYSSLQILYCVNKNIQSNVLKFSHFSCGTNPPMGEISHPDYGGKVPCWYMGENPISNNGR
jgi:hypothetical protein